MMIVTPPTPPTRRFRFAYRVAAYFTYAGGVVCTLSASALMLASAGLAGIAGISVSLGDRLREHGLALYSVGAPMAAAAYRARELFYTRRQKGMALD
jgi:hypothetical protein